MSNLLNRLVVALMIFVPKFLVRRFAGRYIAGDSLDEAVALVKDLNQRGIIATLDILGESITDLNEATKAVADYHLALDAIQEHQLDCNVSLKPSQFGLHLDEAAATKNIEELVAKAQSMDNFIRIDMEDRTLTTPTIEMYKYYRQKYKGHIGTVVQAYLRRTYDDVMGLIDADETNLRICKGIYVEPREDAYKAFDIVRDNYVFVLKHALERGAYMAIATHDEWLFFQADKLITEMNIPPEQFEFQMLLGVDEDLQDLILARGYKLRLYVPYGVEWYAYSMRRLRENPQVAMYIIQNFFRNLFGQKS